ncbi:MAG: hypothetical protein KME16_19405 [Scytolyngbya sp. HA4215-MV1]|nr:hypothetical protein [Scytolyngbya sp. HA4215-MV1]
MPEPTVLAVDTERMNGTFSNSHAPTSFATLATAIENLLARTRRRIVNPASEVGSS